jgi:hypothetical protein
MKPHRGTLILILGILGIIICAPLAIFAWVMGSSDLKEMDAGTMDPAGRSNTNVGKICGIIGTILFVLWLVIFAVFFMIGMATAIHQGAAH